MAESVNRSEAQRLRDELLLGTWLFPREAGVLLATKTSEAAEVTADRSLMEKLDEAAMRLEAPGGALYEIGLEEVASAELRGRIAQTFTLARAMWPGLRVPLPEAFTAAGVQFAEMAQALAGAEELVPVLAPHGLGAPTWEQAFTAIPEAPSLALSPEVVTEFAVLDRVTGPEVPRVTVEGISWTFSLIPATEVPPLVGFNHSHGEHPSLPEMLSLQLAILYKGEDPVDPRSFTWIAGLMRDGKLAARHVTDPGEGVIRISAREPAQQGPHVGARPPVR